MGGQKAVNHEHLEGLRGSSRPPKKKKNLGDKSGLRVTATRHAESPK